MLGRSSPTLLCEVTTVRGVNSSVDIRMSNSSGAEVHMDDAMPEIITDRSIVYRLYYPIPSLTIDLDGEVYTCEAVINSDPVVTNTNSITLDITGKICIRSTFQRPLCRYVCKDGGVSKIYSRLDLADDKFKCV